MKLIFLTFFLWGFESRAFVPSEHTDHPCTLQLEKTLRKHRSRDQWLRVADLDERVAVYRSPTEDFGTWVEVQFAPDPQLFVFSAQKTRYYRFARKGCGTEINTDAKPLALAQIRGDVFSDNNLKSLREKETVSLVYLWSPRNQRSVREIQNAQKFAEKLALNFIPLADPSQSADEVGATLKANNFKIPSPRLGSLEIFFRTGGAAYPSIFLVGKKKISPVIPVGRLIDGASVLASELRAMEVTGAAR